MEARFMAEKPQDIDFTMKITMSAFQWELLRDSLADISRPFKTGGQHHVVTELESKITSLLSQARRTFYPSIPETEVKHGNET